MSGRGCRFFYKQRWRSAVLCTGALIVFCGLEPADTRRPADFHFTVIDVGEGLAQMASSGETAVAFDVGPSGSFDRWKMAYDRAGRPYLDAISISHAHADHSGALSMLDSGVNWSGLLIVGPSGDTAFYRRAVSAVWRDRIRFRKIAAGDTAALLAGAVIRCLWPSAGDTGSAADSLLVNRLSLVYRITCGRTAALITSDIDSSAEQTIAMLWQDSLSAQLLVVPHHGSAGSMNPIFYGYVAPSLAVFSCGKNNPYGHPSTDVLVWLSQMGASVMLTSTGSTCAFSSNGYYWQRDWK